MSSGTNSPPLEATGDKPAAMGAGSVNAVADGKQSGGDVQAVPDREQRGAYFDNAENAKGTADQTGEKVKKD